LLCLSQVYLHPIPANQTTLAIHLPCSGQVYLHAIPANQITSVVHKFALLRPGLLTIYISEQNNVSSPYTCSTQASSTYPLYQRTKQYQQATHLPCSSQLYLPPIPANRTTSAGRTLSLLKPALLTHYTSEPNNVSSPHTCSTQARSTYTLYQRTK
jgi:hypothetical protein